MQLDSGDYTDTADLLRHRNHLSVAFQLNCFIAFFGFPSGPYNMAGETDPVSFLIRSVCFVSVVSAHTGIMLRDPILNFGMLLLCRGLSWIIRSDVRAGKRFNGQATLWNSCNSRLPSLTSASYTNGPTVRGDCDNPNDWANYQPAIIILLSSILILGSTMTPLTFNLGGRQGSPAAKMLSDAGSLGDSQSVVPLSDIDQCLLIYPGLDQSQQAAAMLVFFFYHPSILFKNPPPTDATEGYSLYLSPLALACESAVTGLTHDDGIYCTVAQSYPSTDKKQRACTSRLQNTEFTASRCQLRRSLCDHITCVILCASRFNTVTPRCAAAGLERAADCCSWLENKSSVISFEYLKTTCAARCAAAGLEGAADCCSWFESISCSLSGDAFRIQSFGKTPTEHPKY
ncbi:hypothetical protein Agabi119p4_11082 [Agaricus bisporus var. burnettii]|uniref:Uncharacterized protein n=1 Tax=Agaricus bisporus var. burnettii TaxID=192524 RepID=A0A8H7EVV1_AGABI|nr:hypothetical protein Agabi119p4_11082 [Agaricus bisporus var. burnettii]